MRFENTEVWGFRHAIRGMRNPMASHEKSDSIFTGREKYIGHNDMKLAQSLIKAGSEHRKFLRQIFVSVDITAPAYFMAELDTYKIGITRNSSSFMHKGVSKKFEIEDFEYDDERIAQILSVRKDKENARRDYADGLQRPGNIRADYCNWKTSSKITPFDKCPTHELYKNELSQKQIADQCNVSQSQVSFAIRNSKTDNSDLFEQCWIWEQILDTLNNLRDCYLVSKDTKYFRAIRQMLPQSYLYRSTVTMNYENIYSMCNQRKNHKLTEWSGRDMPHSENFISWARELPYAQEFIFIDETG